MTIDPTTCYQNMMLAMIDNDLELARDYAEHLKHWLSNGGFYPATPSKQTVDDYILFVMCKTEGY